MIPQDYKDFMVMYRSRLSSIVRYAAVVLPEQALQSAGRRLDAAVTACAPGSGQLPGMQEAGLPQSGLSYLMFSLAQTCIIEFVWAAVFFHV